MWCKFSGGRGLANKKMDSLAGDVFGLAKRFDSLRYIFLDIFSSMYPFHEITCFELSRFSSVGESNQSENSF